jgi:hypothetical protein
MLACLILDHLPTVIHTMIAVLRQMVFGTAFLGCGVLGREL